jgi:DNA adenine methylase
MAVALGLRPATALLNDANPHLMNFYHSVQRGLVGDPAWTNEAACYYAARTRFNDLIHTDTATGAAAARLFYYLNRTGYNGLCRFNQAGAFNVPFGRYRTIAYCQDFTPYQAALAGWQLRTGDFAAVPLAPDDFVYADPPYDGAFTRYQAGGFTWADQVRLAEWLTAHPGPVLASNQATPRILDLYGQLGFTLWTLPAPRRIACNGDRTPALEMLATRGARDLVASGGRVAGPAGLQRVHAGSALAPGG